MKIVEFNKPRLTRKERYIKKYINNDKSFQVWQ